MEKTAQPPKNESVSHLQRLVDLGIALSAEKDLDSLLEKILLEAKSLCNADGGTLYLVTEDNKLQFAFLHNDTLKMSMGGTTGKAIPFPPLEMYDPNTEQPNHKNVATHVAVSGEVINIADAYKTQHFDFSGTRDFDKKTNYRSVSFLTVPLKNYQEEVIAVLQLINARDFSGNVISFSASIQRLVEALSSQAAVAIDNQRLILAHRQMMESFIEIIARAIDAKSPYTGAHCQRVPVVARMLTMAATMATEPPFTDFEMTEDDWYTLHLASWLHDCGKVTTPEYVVDKATKLETIHNRIHEIRAEYEILRRDAHILYLKKRLANIGDQKILLEELHETNKQLEEEFAFIAKCNVGRQVLTKEDMEKIKAIAANRKYTRYFDRMLGLSWEEAERTEKQSAPPKPPCEESVLEDRPEHIFGGYNRGEIYNLLVTSGTLTKEERTKVNDHIKLTIEMLNAIPFPKKLKKVPEYAGAHHERIDGKGYPLGLTRDQMSIPARAMAIADIFEALTSTDRPYKLPKKLSETIDIMYNMKKTGHIDPDLFKLFIKSGVYKDYADQYMAPEQIDEVDIEKYLGD